MLIGSTTESIESNNQQQLTLPEPVDVIDIEASGFGRGSYPIEIGVCAYNGVCHCLLVKPEPDWTHWTEEAERTHGLSRDLLVKNGRSTLEIANRLNSLLENRVIYTDAWGHDNSWLMKLYDAAECWPTFKLESIRALMTEQQSALYHDSYTKAQQELLLKRHRASTDAKVIQRAVQLATRI